jgi:hypothetical protein
MPPTLTFAERLRSLFGARDQLGLELVMTANALAAAGIAVLLSLTMGLGVGGLCVAAVGAFVLLTACLLYRPTTWIAAVAGSLTLAITPAVGLAMLTEDLPGGRWPGGVAGAVAGFAFGLWVYRGVARAVIAAHPKHHEE